MNGGDGTLVRRVAAPLYMAFVERIPLNAMRVVMKVGLQTSSSSDANREKPDVGWRVRKRETRGRVWGKRSAIMSEL